MRRIALIPARGGSKRLPRKNILDFLGKPIIAWSIEAAQNTGLFERVVVSTEDEEIAQIAVQFGAEIDKRSQSLATDTASVKDVCIDFLSRNPCDMLCVLYATAPLRSAKDIHAVVHLITPGACDFSLAGTSYSLPPHQALRVSDNKHATPMFPDLIEMRSSDIGELTVDNGSTYAVSVPAFLKEKSFYGSNLKVHVMPRERSQDIDEAQDLDLARFYGQKLQETL